MNPDSHPSFPDDPEARLTAWLLGELGPDEAAALAKEVEQNAELRLLRDRLAGTIHFVRCAAAQPAEPASVAVPQPKLSATRREKLLASFKVVPLPAIQPVRHFGLSAREWWMAAAACAVIMFLGVGMLLPALAKAKSKSMKVASRQADRVEQLAREMKVSEGRASSGTAATPQLGVAVTDAGASARVRQLEDARGEARSAGQVQVQVYLPNQQVAPGDVVEGFAEDGRPAMDPAMVMRYGLIAPGTDASKSRQAAESLDAALAKPTTAAPAGFGDNFISEAVQKPEATQWLYQNAGNAAFDVGGRDGGGLAGGFGGGGVAGGGFGGFGGAAVRSNLRAAAAEASPATGASVTNHVWADYDSDSLSAFGVANGQVQGARTDESRGRAESLARGNTVNWGAAAGNELALSERTLAATDRGFLTASTKTETKAEELAPLPLKLPVPAFMGTPTDIPLGSPEAAPRRFAAPPPVVWATPPAPAVVAAAVPLTKNLAGEIARRGVAANAKEGLTPDAGAKPAEAQVVAQEAIEVASADATEAAPVVVAPASAAVAFPVPVSGPVMFRSTGAGAAPAAQPPATETEKQKESRFFANNAGTHETPAATTANAAAGYQLHLPLAETETVERMRSKEAAPPAVGVAGRLAVAATEGEGRTPVLGDTPMLGRAFVAAKTRASDKAGLTPADGTQDHYFFETKGTAEYGRAAGPGLETAGGLPAVGKAAEVVAEGGARKLVEAGKDEVALKRIGQTAMQQADSKGLGLVPAAPVANQPAAPAQLLAETRDFKPQPRPTTPPPVPQPEVVTLENAFSTFSLNVTDVSFKLAAASLENGQLPDPGAIRAEEFINAFDYRDAQPSPGAAIGFAWERAQYPFAHNREVIRFAVRTAARGREANRPLNLVLLLDNSGSMERADRVQIIRQALGVLAGQLQPLDKVSVVAFARTPRLWVDALPGTQAGELVSRVGDLSPEGGTNLEDALRLAYETAANHFLAGGINRVVLLTDGAANLGDVNPDSLKARVESWRQRGVALDCFGIGWEGYNDDLLEVLSRNGDGRYGFLNTPDEAASGFANQLAGALQVAAADVKVQVEFNPQRVAAWRQVGYAKHQLTKEQFRDNRVDAAELGAAEAGNGLYVLEVNPQGQGNLGVVRARYREPGTGLYRELEWPLYFTGAAAPLENASPTLKLAATAAAFAESLATSPFAAEVNTDRLLGLLANVPAQFAPDPRPGKLEWMIRAAKSLGAN